MKLYPIPGGTWAGTEADFKKQCKARGVDAKTLTGAREVPVAKADLLEFLNFYAVDVYRTGATAAAPDTVVDVAALRAKHNPSPDAPGQPIVPLDAAPLDLDTLFEAAPLSRQLRLAVVAIDAATAKIEGR